MEKRILYIVIAIIGFIVAIIIDSNYNKKEEEKLIQEKEYFKKFDLKLKGVVCDINNYVAGKDALQTLKVLKSNYKEYNLDIKNDSIVFCMQNTKFTVFADNGFHFYHKSIDYEIGDTIYLGFNKEILIRCIDKNGNLKFDKKREQAFLYNIDSPTPEIKKQLEKGCN